MIDPHSYMARLQDRSAHKKLDMLKQDVHVHRDLIKSLPCAFWKQWVSMLREFEVE